MSPQDHNHVDALAEYIAESGWVRFQEMNRFLESRGISTAAGEDELTGGHVMQPHISPDTTLLGPTSREYVEIVQALFGFYPVILLFGDMSDFDGDEPWWVAWVGGCRRPKAAGSRRCPAVNRNVHEIADRAKHAYAIGTQTIAEMQYRLAELAGTGRLDTEESIGLQQSLVRIWESLYSGTVWAVRDEDTPDDTWDEVDNTYSDGRQVINQVRIEPREDSDDCWEHNRFMLGDGAPNEFPLGAVSYIAPIRAEDPAGPRETSRASETSDDGTSLAERLRKYL